MPRSVRDSEEETDIKSGRKTRLNDAVSVDSPLRRSSRIKFVKQNESSPESISSDVSTVSNTQTRVTRRRTVAMDNTTVTEKQKALRSRVNSASSDVNEFTEVDAAATTTTPTKRRGTIINNVLSKTDNRRSKRFTRAGSESKSPPTSTMRNARATSMEPETIAGNKQNKYELTYTPIKTRRRTLMLPSEATVTEEKEENMKVLMVTLDRTLPNVNEIKEMDSNNLPQLEQKGDSVSNIENNLNTDCHNINEKSTENNISENLPSKPEDIEKDTFTDNKNMPDNNKNVSKENENLDAHTVSQMESSIHNLSLSFSQTPSQNTSKELGLKIENLLSNSMEKHGDFSNKENLAANVISDESSIENTDSNTLLQSPKPLSASNPNKLVKGKYKSSCNLSSQNRHSRSSESMDDAITSVKEVKNDNVTNNSVIENMNVSINSEDMDTSDNMSKLAIETDSLNESTFNINSNRSITLKICSDSSLDGSIELVKCMEDVKTIDYNDELIDTDTTLNTETGKIHNEEYNEIAMDASNAVSNVEKVMNNKNDVMKAGTESENVQNDDRVNCTSTRSSLNLTSVALLTSSNKISTINTEFSTVSKNKSTSEFESINKVNMSTPNTNNVLESLDAHMSPKNSVSTNIGKGSTTDVVKSSLSSTIIEVQIKLTDEVSKKEEVSLNNSLTSKNHLIEKLESDKQKSESIQGTCNKSQASMDCDDNDSNKNAVNLFQDIPADEWKEENVNIDKNSIHSMSTERLENEVEAECDLVLVDKETWAFVENMKAQREKEASDYDSDDTILLKMQRDSIQGQKNEQMKMHTLKNTNQMKDSKNSTTNKNDADNENAMKNTDNCKDKTQNKDFRNISQNKSITEEQNNRTEEHSLPEHNVSGLQSVEEKHTFELRKKAEIKENLSSDESNLSEDVPVKRISLNKPICKIDNELEKSNKTESVKNRKSLNKSNHEEKETTTAELNSENIVITSAKSVKEKRSLNNCSKKQINRIVDSDNEFKDSSTPKKENSATKKKVHRNHSTIAGVESDDGNTESNSDDSQNKTIELPQFLLAEAFNSDSNDGNESDKSINSNLEKEYNLHGKDISKFSDDDVPGDECRASETESSDLDDNESDLADFVVDDDDLENEDTELVELMEKTSFSKPLSSKVSELNKTTLIPDSETPTTKYLRKEKLNESAPVLKLDTKFKKLINANDDGKQNNSLIQVNKENKVVHTTDVETAQELNTSLKGKLLNIADSILDIDRRKKHKKRKQTKERNNRDTLVAVSFYEDVASQIKNENEYIDTIGNTVKSEKFEETSSNEGKKNRKKKQKITRTNMNKHTKEEASYEEFIDTKSEVTKKSVPKKVKKQKKEITENVPNIYPEKQISEKKSNKISRALLNEEVTTTQISKKKQKLLSADITLPNNKTVIKKLSKKKKKIMSEDVCSQHDEVPLKKLCKKKQNLSSDDFSQSENISAKESSKKKDKLLLESDRRNKVKSDKTCNKSQQFNNIISNSDEGPTTVKFSEARDEILKVIKPTADKMKTNKKIEKKKRKKHVEEMRKEVEDKNPELKIREIHISKTEMQKKGVKRLPDEDLEKLSDVPPKLIKKKKQVSKTEEQVLPSRTVFDSRAKEVKDANIKKDFERPSSYGSTTQFTVVNIGKIKKKKVPSVISFKPKILARNSRQPVSAYLMYLAKQKASGKDRLCNKPY